MVQLIGLYWNVQAVPDVCLTILFVANQKILTKQVKKMLKEERIMRIVSIINLKGGVGYGK